MSLCFFFIICASTCILAFAKSDNMSRTAKNLNQGILAAESTAEIWKAEGVDGLMSRMAFDRGENGVYGTWLDENWQVMEEWKSLEQFERSFERPAYVVLAEITEDGGGLWKANIQVCTGTKSKAASEEIFSLEVKKYFHP